jgi:glucosyl-dolichyl phosphate glucuronosyltransferase
MKAAKLISVLITTRNRCEHLRKTLESLKNIDWIDCSLSELIVVDNNSTDNTSATVNEFKKGYPVELIYVHESRTGQSYARNTAMEIASGELFVWTDDDVVPPHDWISKMLRPLQSGEAQGVAGLIRMAPYLERPWMTRTHYDRLSDTRHMGDDKMWVMVGANMAFTRDVLKQVPAFDPELGPGALGFYDDSLFSRQMLEIGMKIATVNNSIVEHHLSQDRLLRKSWLDNGKKMGRSTAYGYYHWEHGDTKNAKIKKIFYKSALALFRIIKPPHGLEVEGCDRREIRLFQHYQYWDMIDSLIGSPFKYDKHGLVKKL